MEVPTPEQIHAAKVAIAGGFGASVFVFLRHPGSLAKAIFMVIIGVGIASIFSDYAASITGLGEVQSAALLGMVGLVVAGRLVDMADTFDLLKVIKKK